MNAYDNSLLLFIDVSILAVLALLITAALMQCADLLLDTRAQRVFMVIGILLILVVGELINLLVTVGRGGLCIGACITVIVL